jgi:hypothetical protein
MTASRVTRAGGDCHVTTRKIGVIPGISGVLYVDASGNMTEQSHSNAQPSSPSDLQ